MNTSSESYEKVRKMICMTNEYFDDEYPIPWICTKNKVARPLGDVEIEEILETIVTTEPSTTSITTEKMVRPIKKDFMTITPFSSIGIVQIDTLLSTGTNRHVVCKRQTDIIKYAVYAVLVDEMTYVITLVLRNYNPLPTLSYSESTLDPSDIIDNAYLYEVGRPRSLYLRNYAKRVNNPDQIIDLNVLQQPETGPEKVFDGTIFVTDVDEELINLSIIVKNGEYISSDPFEKLLFTVNSLISF
jgi:hypothetical protein